MGGPLYTGHFADNTNLPLVEKSFKKINKHINHNLKLLTTWLRANKISLNTTKTEILLFRPKSKEKHNKAPKFRNQWLVYSTNNE